MSKRKVELQKVCSTGKDFLKQFNFDYCADRYRILNTQKAALVSKMINLRELTNVYNQETPRLLLSLWLTQLCLFMGFEAIEIQLRQTSEYMYEEIGMLNLAELTLLFHRIREGFYGEFYGKFNPQIVLRACREYRKERGCIISKMSTNQQNEILNTLYSK
ncbi:hypothetical protein LH29_00560 [Draconibacterium sediminis]|uniref:Uncharacterized protein n=1 Tax=Draconibacterium sediminis TaxID=1544798 RepID=A0A0D8JC13_9BACT|nr:hypothetical protein LH29_00560 [Draconibacterium sediminis]